MSDPYMWDAINNANMMRYRPHEHKGMIRRYAWIYDRVVAGEVVSIDTRRKDMVAIWDWLTNLPSQDPNWHIQLDTDHDLVWIMQNREENG